MRRIILLSVVSLICNLPCAAQTPSFEDALGSFRQDIHEQRAARLQSKDARHASDLHRAAREADSMAWEASRLRSTVSDVRRRAQNASRDNGQQPDRQDPFLRNEVRRLVWDLRDFNQRVGRTADDVSRIQRSITEKDPELVSPAMNLSRAARQLASDARWMSDEARWAAFDLRRAGFNFESWDVERESEGAESSARRLESDAQRILAQVR